MREALLLDLGAVVFELDRQGRREPDLVHAKQIELRVVDDEVRGLADALEEGIGLPALTASGLVASCTACERLMGSRDRFCPACGAAAGASEAAERKGEAPAPMREPDFGDTIEVTALNAAGHPALDEPESREEAREPAGGPAPWSEPAPKALVPLAQRKLRAGRRMARQWLEQRRPDAP